jgi:hypothetical protein
MSLSPLAIEREQDPDLRRVRDFMLPHPHHSPAKSFKAGRGLSVTRSVARELGHPVARVPLGDCAMNRTRVPVTSVNEHRYTRLRECQVHADQTPRVWPNRVINSIPQAPGMQYPPQCQLRAGIPATVPPHHGRRMSGRWDRSLEQHVRSVAIAHRRPRHWLHHTYSLS